MRTFISVLSMILLTSTLGARVSATDSTIFSNVRLLSNAPLRDNPNPDGRTIHEIPATATLEVFGENFDGYLMVRHAGKVGYVHYLKFDRQSIPGSLSRIFNTDRSDDATMALQRIFGRATTSRILRREIWRGMTAEMVRESIGRPTQLERITQRGLTREEWSYDDGRMLVLKSGKVSLIDDAD